MSGAAGDGDGSSGAPGRDDPLAAHWNRIYVGKPETELGWYEADAGRTLAFLDLVPSGPVPRVFLPGAGTSRLVDALASRGMRLILDDVSDEALARLRDRLGAAGAEAVWLHHDVSRPLPEGLPPVDLWIDRAVLHFLLEERAIDGYFANLRGLLRPGGHVLLAEFAETGATRCAGRDVHRYSLDEMARRLGPEFTLVKAEESVFVNPSGAPRPYLHALFRRAGQNQKTG